MTAFLGPDFLLDTPQARALYHGFAEGKPILDYHCHLDPALIAADHRFADLAEAWLAGDHYKWRAMRTNGVPERFCTGEASPREKFDAWACTVPALLRNPLYHWTHLELKAPLGIEGVLLGPATADRIWAEANVRLAEPGMTTRGILRRMNVEVVCTTDDPADSLEHHRSIAADGSFPVKVLPTWRPDRVRAVGDPVAWNAWVKRLGRAAGREIASFDGLMEALEERHGAFHAAGCRLSDHGVEGFPSTRATWDQARGTVARLLAGLRPEPAEAEAFQGLLLFELAALDARKGWVRQLHLGALRNPNPAAFERLGPDTGFDSIDDACYIRPLAAHLGALEAAGTLPRTILYNLNPRDNEALAALVGSFQDGSCPGRIQFGAAWWFLDQLEGMTRQIETLSQLGLLSRWVGMLTDSRSFLSWSRHEYFRRLLCRILGRDMQGGLIPDDLPLVGSLVEDLCHRNARTHFAFPGVNA